MCTTRPKRSTRRATTACCLRALAAWLLLLGALCAPALPAAAASSEPAVLRLVWADARLEPDGLPARNVQCLALQHRWDSSYPRSGGHAVYRLPLPPGDGEPKALHFARLGNQATIRINGHVVQRIGELGHPLFDAAKTSWLVNVPAALLSERDDNVLEVEVTIQPARYGGLWPVEYGDPAAVADSYEDLKRWHGGASIWLGSAWLVMGLAALGLWSQQRDSLYGWFALSALLGVVRHVDRIWPDVPVPWPHWGLIVAACYGLHLVTILRVIQAMLEHERRWLSRLMAGTAVLVVGAALVAFEANLPRVWTAGLVAIIPYGFVVLVLTVRAMRRNRQAMSWAVLATGVVAFACALHDLGWVRIGAPSAQAINISVLPLAIFAIALVTGALIVKRYNATVLAYRQLNADLAQRVAQRERELSAAFEAMEQQQREQAVLKERQRIMREIHDGIGSQLVGILNLASKGASAPALIEEHVRIALDEMRMAIDSLQPVHGDLSTVLATLRYRLQPRLEAAQIAVDWDVPALPPLRELTPEAVLQVQRILLEGLTNTLKHSHARRVALTVRFLDGASPQVTIELADDGVGFDSGADAVPSPAGAPTRRHGLANMRHRAESIGARFEIVPGVPRGTCIRLTWPVRC